MKFELGVSRPGDPHYLDPRLLWLDLYYNLSQGWTSGPIRLDFWFTSSMKKTYWWTMSMRSTRAEAEINIGSCKAAQGSTLVFKCLGVLSFRGNQTKENAEIKCWSSGCKMGVDDEHIFIPRFRHMWNSIEFILH